MTTVKIITSSHILLGPPVGYSRPQAGVDEICIASKFNHQLLKVPASAFKVPVLKT